MAVSNFVAIALLLLAAGEALLIRHLYAHRTISIQLSGTGIQPQRPVDDDAYVTHCFPDDCEVCDGFDHICSIKI